MASVNRDPLSPFWIASIRYWLKIPGHPYGGVWKRARRSTKIPLTKSKKDALLVANEIERTTSDAHKETASPRAFYEQAVQRILSAARVESSSLAPSWRKWSEQWLSEQHVKPKTLVGYKCQVGQFTDFLGARADSPLTHLTHVDCANYHTAAMRDGCSPNTARLRIVTVKMCLARAVETGLLQRNPAAAVKTSKEQVLDRQPFTIEDTQALLAYFDAKGLKEWRIAALFGLYYGLRIGDATNRSFAEVREDNGLKVISFIPEKKSRYGKKITLPLIGELAKLKGKGFITPTLKDRWNLSAEFAEMLTQIPEIKRKTVKSKRKFQNKSFHSLRHTCNTMLMNSGVDQRIRQLVSDHESQAVNDRYTHAAIEGVHEALTKTFSVKRALPVRATE